MVLQIIITAVIVFVFAIIVNGVEDYNKERTLVKMSFEDTMGRLELPIVTLTNNNKQFNFLIDTGAAYSIIDTIALDELNHTKIEGVEGSAYGIDGKIIPIQYAKISLSYNNKEFIDEFQIMRMGAFDNLKENDNIELAGILGSAFLERYNFIIDFKELIVYSTKIK